MTIARRILIIAAAPAQLLDLAGPAEVFNQACRLAWHEGTNSVPSAPYAVDLAILPPTTGAHAAANTTAGIEVAACASRESLLADERPLDTLVVCGGEGARARTGEGDLSGAIRVLAARARRTVSICTGAYLLAAAGLLQGRRVTTHWRWCADLARRYPGVSVDPDPIFVRDGELWTSAGVTAGIDLALALVEDDHGHALALAIARELVMFLRRPGGQNQFSASLRAQTAPPHTMRELLAWLADNLHRRLSVADMADRAAMSDRQFARVFSREVGLPPARMLERLRVEAARRRLEERPQPLAGVAAACGFGDEETMRRAFLRQLKTSPGSYRERFKRNAPLVIHPA